jgi:putative photosynthetic complex assembly protein 2
MLEFALPPIAAVLLWWLGTGIVIVLDRLPGASRGGRMVALVGSSCFAVAALVCIEQTAQALSVSAAYAAFTCAVVLWAWHELAFLGGWLSGPRRVAATPGTRGLPRLAQAIQVLLWHELALLATCVGLWLWLGGSANPTAAWTFTVLYAMRVSAKVNLYLGVRNLSLDFLPPHLLYLGSYFRQQSFNALMPCSLLAAAAATGWLVLGAQDTSGGEQAARLLLASLLALALVEHLMMVLPLEPSSLWRWALRRPAEVRS